MATFYFLRWQPSPYPPSLMAYLTPPPPPPPRTPDFFSSKWMQRMYFRSSRWLRSLSFWGDREKNLKGGGNHPHGRVRVKVPTQTYNCDYLPHTTFCFFLINFQLNTNFLPNFAFLPSNHIALIKDQFLKKMLLKKSKKPVTFYFYNGLWAICSQLWPLKGLKVLGYRNFTMLPIQGHKTAVQSSRARLALINA